MVRLLHAPARLLSLLAAVGLTSSAVATAAPGACVEEGLQLFPAPGAVVPTNSRFILEGIGPHADRVWDLIGQKLTLRADDDVTTVLVLKGWRSAKGRSAVILKPRAFLKSNRRYRLELGGLDALPMHNAPEGAVWSTGRGPDTKGPRWVERPNVAEGLYTAHDKDKKTRQLRFRLRMKEESPAYLVLSIRRARGPQNVQSYFAPIRGGDAFIGHDACSGNFDFDDGRAYRTRIEAYDSAGNPAPRLRQLEFHAPRPLIAQ